MNIRNIFSIALFAFALAGTADAQINTLTSTTLSKAVLAVDRIVNLTSATGVNAPQPGVVGSELYVISPGNPRGEVMVVVSVNSTAVTVTRGSQGLQSDIPNGSTVLIGQPNWFYSYDPSGGCTAAATYVTPWVNTKTGAQWLCSTITLSWVPGWQNDYATPAVTTAVASAAGAILPSGQLFHVTGTAAITGFTLPVGYAGGPFCVIPDGIFTTTTAGNIALASTAVVNRLLCFAYDATNSKFVPGY